MKVKLIKQQHEYINAIALFTMRPSNIQASIKLQYAIKLTLINVKQQKQS